MKKIILLFILLLLTACNTKDDQLSVVVASGAPSLAFYTELDNPNFNTANSQSIIPEFFSENGEDIIVVDTLNGIRAINSGAEYKLAATLTLGNFYIASTGLDIDKVMNENDYIVLFSQNATPDVIFHSLYLDSLDNSIHYVDSVNDALVCLVKGINVTDDNMPIDEKYVDYVMIAEPALDMALMQNEDCFIYQNIQDLYYEKYKSKMIQASIFVSNRLDSNTIDNYLNKIKNNVENLLNNPSTFEEYIMEKNLSQEEVKDIFGVANSKIVTKVLSNNSIGLDYVVSYDIKDDIDKFMNLFSQETLKDEGYYK